MNTTLCEGADLNLPEAAFVAVTVQVLAAEPADLRTAVPAVPLTDSNVQPSEGLVVKLTNPLPDPPLVLTKMEPDLRTEVDSAELLIENEA